MEQVLMHEAQRWVAPWPAWVVARDGVLWVTRSGDLDDHVLTRGERLAVARGDDLVIQSWRRDVPAVWDWQAQPAAHASLRRSVLAWGWGRAARGLGRAAVGLAALARDAAARACRAEDCRSGA